MKRICYELTPYRKRQSMSMNRQLKPNWRVLAKKHLRGRQLKKHAHSSDQLLFATSGLMQVQTDHGQWTVPPQRALWIPAGVVHSVVVLSDTEMQTVYFSGSEESSEGGQVQALVTSALLRELILALFDGKHNVMTQQVMVNLLQQIVPTCEKLRCYLTLPRHPLLLEATTWFMSNRLWDLSLADAAEKVGMSERSFTRHFSADVGGSFRQWRQQARIVGSMDRLTAGDPVKQVADLAGFASASSYIVAFKHVTGCTPAQFIAQV